MVKRSFLRVPFERKSIMVVQTCYAPKLDTLSEYPVFDALTDAKFTG